MRRAEYNVERVAGGWHLVTWWDSTNHLRKLRFMGYTRREIDAEMRYRDVDS